MRVRYYVPELKRFINEDIVTGDISNSNSLNRYSYVEGNPVSMIDPFGLCAEKASKFCNSELGFKVGLDILKTAGGIALAVFVPGAQGIGISMAISGASGLILDGITAFGVEMDAKTSSTVGNTVQIVSGAGLMLNPSTAAYGASEIGSGLGGLIGGYVGETAYKAVTGEESDKAYLVGASLGNIAGGYVGDLSYKSIQNLASKSGTETELFLPDEFYNKNLPSQVTPGTKYLPKYDEVGNVKQIKMYDDYGREIGWVDYTNHGYGNVNTPDYHTTPHWHERIYNAQYPDGIKINHRTDINTPLGDK